jgi:hypothetical protein
MTTADTTFAVRHLKQLNPKILKRFMLWLNIATMVGSEEI